MSKGFQQLTCKLLWFTHDIVKAPHLRTWFSVSITSRLKPEAATRLAMSRT